MSDLLAQLRSRAAKLDARVALPDAVDVRTLQAARQLVNEKIARPLLVGSRSAIEELGETAGVSLSDITIVDPSTDEGTTERAAHYARRRSGKGETPESAAEQMLDPLYTAGVMLRTGEVDAVVAGSTSTTGDVLRAALRTIGAFPNTIVSSWFLMIPRSSKGSKSTPLAFADGGVVPQPSAEELAKIGVRTAISYRSITGNEPRVAFLSFSTFGSADHPDATKVREAVAIARKIVGSEERSNLDPTWFDGEMQLDTAVDSKVARRKAPDSSVAGNANVLIFPDLDAANIGYKLVERLGNARAIGPLVQGLDRPMFDLSRGCSVEDIVDVVTIALLTGPIRKRST